MNDSCFDVSVVDWCRSILPLSFRVTKRHTIAPVPVKQSWRIWSNITYESIERCQHKQYKTKHNKSVSPLTLRWKCQNFHYFLYQKISFLQLPVQTAMKIVIKGKFPFHYLMCRYAYLQHMTSLHQADVHASALRFPHTEVSFCWPHLDTAKWPQSPGVSETMTWWILVITREHLVLLRPYSHRYLRSLDLTIRVTIDLTFNAEILEPSRFLTHCDAIWHH